MKRKRPHSMRQNPQITNKKNPFFFFIFLLSSFLKMDSSVSSKTKPSMTRYIRPERIHRREYPDENQLPETIKLIREPTTNATIYLVGTAHFSEKSQREVAEIIGKTQPDLVMVELCPSRVNILSLDEATLLREASQMNMDKLRSLIKSNGVIHGIIHVLLLSMTAHLTKQLGMAPGGEFRTAFKQARKVPGCRVVLGDRPVGITLKRAINSLSLWKKICLAFSLLTSKEKITNEDVEKCMQEDMLERLLNEMSSKYPELSRVFVKERDQYLSYSLRKCSQLIPIETNEIGFIPPTIVAVVGIGHVQGIIQQFSQPSIDDIQHLMNLNIDESKADRKSSKYFHVSTGIKLFLIGGFLFGLYHFGRSRLR